MSRRGLENIKIGIIGIGNKDGAVGFETIPLLTEIPEIEQILVTNRDTSKSKKSVQTYIDSNLKEKAEGERVIQASVEDMRDLCDLIVLAFETSIGASQKNIPLDYYFRQRCFKGNIAALKKDIGPRLKGYDGLLLTVTNPPEAMCYYIPELVWGINRDQVIGFQHIDTDRFRRACTKRYKTHPFLDDPDITDDLIKRILKANEPEGGLVFGEHGPNMIGIYSVIKMMKIHRWNDYKTLNSLNEQIMQAVRKEGIDIAKAVGATGKNAAPVLSDLIYGAITQKGMFTGTYFIKLEEYLREKIFKEYNVDVEGICTGVPIEFYLENASENKPENSKRKMVIRAKLAKQYMKAPFDFNFNAISAEEAAQFRECIKITATGKGKNSRSSEPAKPSLLETRIFKEKEGTPRYLIENSVAVVSGKDHYEVMLIETSLREDKETDPSLLLDGLLSTRFDLQKYAVKGTGWPEVTAIATEDNLIAVSVCEDEKYRTLHVFELPYQELSDLIVGSAAGLKRRCAIDLDGNNKDLEEKNRINFMTMQDRRIYFAEDKSIEQRYMATVEDEGKRINFKGKEKISALASNDTGIYVGLSNGEIIQFNSNLEEINRYDTGTDSKIKKIKQINYKGRPYVYASNNRGQLHAFIGSPDNHKQIKSFGNRCCFDVQVEQYEKEEIICIYSYENSKINIKALTDKRLIRESLNENNFERSIPYASGNEVKDLIAKGDELYIVSETGISSIMDKNRDGSIKPLPINNFTKIKNIEFAKYKK